MNGQQKFRPKFPTVFAVVGCVMASLSFVNLVNDLDIVKLYGAVDRWIGAYGLLINTISSVLFSWIEWRWIRINDAEAHLLTIGFLVAVAVVKAVWYQNREKDGYFPSLRGACVAAFALVFLPLFLATLLLPDAIGTYLSAFILAYEIHFWGFSNKSSELMKPANVRYQLLSVIVVFLLVVLVNYLVFKP